jgi:hypothetical protein
MDEIFFHKIQVWRFYMYHGWVFVTTLANIMHTNMLTCGSLIMWHVASFRLKKYVAKQFFFNHPIKATILSRGGLKLCHVAT